MSKEVKYIIVGQGIAGTLLSWQLIKRKIKHVVVASAEKKSSSLVAAGMFNPLVFRRITKSWMIDTLLPDLYGVYLELEEKLNKKLIFHIPILKLIQPEEKEWWVERIKSQELNNFYTEFIGKGMFTGICPQFESVSLKNSGFIDLTILVKSFRNFLISKGSYIEKIFNVEELLIKDRFVEWNDYRAEKAIFCEGSKAVENSYFKEVEFYLTRGDLLEVEIKSLNQNFIYNKEIFVLPKGNNVFIIGSTYDHKTIDWNPNPEAVKYLLDKASKIITEPIKLLHHKAGVRPTVKDRRPVLGFHPQHKELAIFNGLGTKGVMLAPFFSKEMVKLLENPDYKVATEVQIDRFYTET